MSALTRVVIGVGTLGGVAAGGYLLHRQLSTDNIEKKLTTNGYKILDAKSDEWTKMLASYKATISKENDLKFGEFKGEQGQEETLRTECKKALEAPSSDDANYKKAERWCVSPKSLEDVLKNQKFRLLIIKENDDIEDKDEWDRKLDSHHKPATGNEDNKFSDLKIAVGGTLKKDKGERDAIKEKCKELKGKKHYEQDFSTNLEKAKLWCAIKEDK